MQHSTKNRQQKTRSGLRTKTGQVMSALAEFIKRPQADTQIGAEGIVEESAGDVKGVCAGCGDRVFDTHECVF
jgi:hypothetical protein